MKIYLDNRLKEIVNLIGKVDVVVDVGCDHGYVSNYLVEENLSDLVYASDISYDSLMKNKEFAEKRKNSDKVISLHGNGLIPLKDKYFSGAIIAGMGGELIIKILEDSKELVRDKILVLQPMTAQKELRRYLSENGYEIIKESLVKESGKYYEIIKARSGNSEGSTCNYYFGENLIRDCDETFLEYVDFLRTKTLGLLEMAKVSETEKGRDRVKVLEEEINLYEVILDGCKGKGNY